MTPEQAKLAELALIVVAVLGLGAWQLWSVKRDQKRHGDRRPGDRDGER
jgi:hypothetical protein